MSDQHISSLLTELGVPSEKKDTSYCCPLHAKPSFTLLFIESNILPGNYRVKCTDTKCGFSGTVFDLIAETTGKPMSDVFSEFLPDNRFYNTFIPKERNKSTYRLAVGDNMSQVNSNRDMVAYLKEGRKELLNSSFLRSYLIGCGIREDIIPALTVTKYNKLMPDSVTPGRLASTTHDRLLLPYTCHGRVVEVRLLDPKTRKQKHITLVEAAASSGIFQEEHLDMENPVNVCQDETAAMLLSSKINEVTNKASNAVYMVSNKATKLLSDGQPVQLISTEDNTLKLARAIHFWKVRESRPVRVVEIPGRIKKISGHRLNMLLRHAESIETWIVEHILDLNRTESTNAIKGVVASLSLTAKDKSDLIDLVAASGKADPFLLSAIKDSKTEDSQFSSGKLVFRRAASSYVQVTGHSRVLSNCVFYADMVTDDESGNKVLLGRVRTDRPEEPLYNVVLPTKKLLINKGAPVGELIWSQLKEQGSQWRPNLRDLHGGPTWFCMFNNLDDTYFVKNMAVLGVQGDKVINFPNVRVDVQTGTVSSGQLLYGIDDDVLAAYSAIGNSQEADYELLRAIVESDSNLMRRIMLLYGHLLHQTASAAAAGDRYAPKHIIIPTTGDDDIWSNAFSQTYYVMSGRPRPPAVPALAGQFNKFAKNNRKYGTLPGMYICRVSPSLKDLAYSSKNSMVLLTKYTETAQLSRESYTYFAHDRDEEVASRDVLDEEVADVLRRAFPRLLIAAAERVSVRSDCGVKVLPAMRGLEWIQDEIGSNADYSDIDVTFHYTVRGKNSLELFLSLIADEVLGGGMHIARSAREYKEEPDRYVGYYIANRDLLMIPPKKAVKALGQSGASFSVKHLSEQASKNDRGELRIDRVLWDTHYKPAVGEPLTFDKLTLMDKTS